MRLLMFILLISSFLVSCKSPQKSVSSSKIDQETSARNDVSLTENIRLSELTDQIIQRLVSERLNVGVKQIKYDTDKPVNKETGRHPVVEEIEIGISKETEVYETDSIRQKIEGISTVELTDQSATNTKIKAEIREEKETGLKNWQKVLAIIGGLAVFGFVVFMIIKIMGITRKYN